MIDTTSATPLYAQVKDDLLQKVQQGHFGTTNRIPSEKELAKIYNVSLITVRRAVEELVEGNILQKKQGKGTFIVQKPFNRTFSATATSFTESCTVNGMTASAKLLRGEVVQNVDSRILKDLSLPSDSRVVLIERLRFANGQPIVIETSYFPIRYAYLLELDLENMSMYSLLYAHEKNLKMVARPGTRELRLVAADAQTAHLLELRPGSVILSMKGLVFDETTDCPVYLSSHKGYSAKYDFCLVV